LLARQSQLTPSRFLHNGIYVTSARSTNSLPVRLLYNFRVVPNSARTLIAPLLLLSAWATCQDLPRPQIPSAVGKPAPNFILKDEHGKTVSLASMRGKRVLLIFYRGYW
jgi:AhpC/TSA family protein